MRFGQLMVCCFGALYRDPFFPEDDAMIKHIESYCEAHNPYSGNNSDIPVSSDRLRDVSTPDLVAALEKRDNVEVIRIRKPDEPCVRMDEGKITIIRVRDEQLN